MKKKALLIFFIIICLGMGTILMWSHFQALLKKPLFSVIMVTYNREKLLPQAIESVLAQTYPSFELIIIDDGSTDNTKALIQQYQAQDKRIRFFQNKKNKGICYSRNRALRVARGKYVVTLDSDDIMRSVLLEKMVDYFQIYPKTTLVYPLHEYFFEGSDDYYSEPHFPIISFFKENIIQNSGAVFDLSFVRQKGIKYNEKLLRVEDYDFWIQMVVNGARIGQLNEKLVVFRLRDRTKEYQKETEILKYAVLENLYNYFQIPYAKRDDLCFIIQQIQKKKSPFLESDLLKQHLKGFCLPLNKPTEKVIHLHWKGLIVFESEQRAYRLGVINEEAQIVRKTVDSFVLKWDKWGTEIFERQSDGFYHLKQD